MLKSDCVHIVGAGLAGSEAAWQLAQRGIKVKLYEMRPEKTTPAHKTEFFAELVCSNSLRADNIENAVGLLKKEMEMCDSLIIKAATLFKVPAGGALAVDRILFSKYVTDTLKNHPYIEFINEEVINLAALDGIVIIASGPLTSEDLSKEIKSLIKKDYLYFYDAAAPLLDFESIDKNKVFFASRYDKGEKDYINCPMNKEEYLLFLNELLTAEKAPIQEFEKSIFFEGCMPIEEMACRGEDTLRYGPLKPVGLINPKTNEEPYAVIQLRQDDAKATIYNMVGFQTNLKWGEQKRVFKMIPGLENAEFLRYGVMHKNTFINSPEILNPDFSMKENEKYFFAGQITGVEGYVESAASGLVAGINAALKIKSNKKFVFPRDTAIGALSDYISSDQIKRFQPMNINFGLLPKLPFKVKGKKNKNREIALLALEKMKEIQENLV